MISLANSKACWVLAVSANTTSSQPRKARDFGWQPDEVLEGFDAFTFSVTPDEGESEAPTATIVRAGDPSWWASRFGVASNVDVLYLHGWSDYFFQAHLAQFWRERGARFFALDLRRYGRNITERTLAGYVSDVRVYDDEIGTAIELIRRLGRRNSGRKLVLMGHSTGGLVASLWAQRHPDQVAALVLNSPWLELQTRELGRLALAPMIGALGKYQPKVAFKVSEPGFYARTVSKRLEGEWDIDARWRPDRSFAIYPGWLSAIVRAQKEVAAGLDLRLPILALLSERSVFSATWQESMRSADIVLDVTGVARRVADLGSDVSISRIPDALHDVFLSPQPVRDHAFAQLDRWLRMQRAVATFSRQV